MTKLGFLSVCALPVSALVGGCSDGGDGVTGEDTTGSIRVTTSTAGEILDSDGYACRLDGPYRREGRLPKEPPLLRLPRLSCT